MVEVEAPLGAQYFAALDAAFDEAVAPLRIGAEPLTVLFSGGVDSSTLAIAVRDVAELELLTIGVRGCRDESAARSAAEILGLRSTFAAVDSEVVLAALERYAAELSGARGPARAVAVALALAFENATHRRVVAAQGIDELFLGYHHFRGLDEVASRRQVQEDLDALTGREWPRAVALGRATQREVRAPFLDPRWITTVQSIALAERQPGALGKELFRAWARHRGVPDALAVRPKRAFQYGSGIHPLLGGR
ncbi:MAG: asparagine synthase C-terminal domain-containing protein [Thermoplasmata archaeon]